ncbi:hypothetical protein SFUMM280S_01622 [Streptomyces fumanus]
MSPAEALDELLKTEDMGLDAVLDLEAPEEEVVKRIAGRQDAGTIRRTSFT